MPNLYCENDCTKHEVELIGNEKEQLQKIFDDIDYEFESIKYEQSTSKIIITFVDEVE
tara:strand:- start:86 stop:259 length:174 start_codon:yes stop_codon:yes gene_type:complete